MSTQGLKILKSVRRGIQHTEDVSLSYYFHVIAAKVRGMRFRFLKIAVFLAKLEAMSWSPEK